MRYLFKKFFISLSSSVFYILRIVVGRKSPFFICRNLDAEQSVNIRKDISHHIEMVRRINNALKSILREIVTLKYSESDIRAYSHCYCS